MQSHPGQGHKLDSLMVHLVAFYDMQDHSSIHSHVCPRYRAKAVIRKKRSNRPATMNLDCITTTCYIRIILSHPDMIVYQISCLKTAKKLRTEEGQFVC